MNYACYNILSTIAILGPFGAHIRKRSTVYAGLGLGSGMLLVIALSVMTCLAVWPAAQSHELPWLAAAAGLGAVPDVCLCAAAVCWDVRLSAFKRSRIRELLLRKAHAAPGAEGRLHRPGRPAGPISPASSASAA